MNRDTEVSNLIINELTKAEFDSIEKSETELYFVTDEDYYATKTELNDKADISASNLNTQGKSYISGLGMPSNRYIDLTLGASGSTYTAPANGWVVIHKTAGASGQRLQIRNEKDVGFSFFSAGNSQSMQAMIPVKKNSTYTIVYTLSGETTAFRFIYAEGEE